MEIINKLASWFLKKRSHQIKLFLENPHEVQEEWFNDLIFRARDTAWGAKYSYNRIENYNQFKELVPINTYDDLKPWIERARKGEYDVLWPGKVRWFAKSSGTTSDKSKFIPVTEESLEDCHYKGGKDLLAFYYENYPDSEMLNGKTIGVAGSSKPDETNEDNYVGDLSAILMNNLPMWAHITKTPNLSVTLMDNWDEKVELIAKHTIEDDVRVVSGVPSWMLVILHKVLEISGKQYINEVWPKFELVVHGGVSFKPYENQFKTLFSKPVNYWEVYNASEGFFGAQDKSDRNDMLLMLDYGIFYEFIALDDLENNPHNTLPLKEVEMGVNYAMLISSNAGLWRYLVGDTVTFTSLQPYRIQIIGRISSYINVVGEELMVDNADKAISIACEHTKSIVKEYTAAPRFNKDGSPRCHQWVIEFELEPEDIKFFAHVFDNALRAVNSDYEAKRYQDMVLKEPEIHVAKKGTFVHWLASQGKLGGQYKVPRLSNNRKTLEEILSHE
jgi:hypothetical protein